MKLNKSKILGSLSLATLLATTSCRDDTFSEYFDNSDEITVTINVGLEGMSSSTRADNNVKAHSIGEGSKIDMLVYAVYYRTESNPDWQAATEYSKSYNEGDKIPFDGEVKPGYGQTIIDSSETLQLGKAQPIVLTLKKGQKYKVVFWAQNHETEAFVIDDLKRVQMKYKVLHENLDNPDDPKDDIHSVNNDEARDAFCRSIELDGNQSNRNITIYLRRPLAQINVGTRGFDFETITRNSGKNEKYLYSKIRINRAARYLNVLEDKVYTTTIESTDPNGSTEAFYTIDYEYAKLPAYWLFEDDEVPEFPSYTIYDLEDENGKPNTEGAYSTFTKLHEDFFISEDDASRQKEFRHYYGKEEFLKVRLFDHTQEEMNQYGGGKDFDYMPYEGLGKAMNTDETKQNRSEVFKYLSMCYVLTSSDDESQDVLTNVKVWLAKDKDGRDEVEIANLSNVPVQRNHRTNIVGSLLTAKADMNIIVDQNFGGRKIYGETGLKSGEITDGFYYDAAANDGNGEFQISSLNGLLFFQQLVNGDLTVRQVSNNPTDISPSPSINNKYKYRDNLGEEQTLNYTSHSFNEVNNYNSEAAKIILVGSGYNEFNQSGEEYIQSVEKDGKTWKIKVKKNSNNWPEKNNFPFYGVKVKLMADIDLSGIEWIPIGFDCVNWDSTLGAIKDGGGYNQYYTNGGKTINYTSLTPPVDNTDVIDLSYRRVFCGEFDGNGHTIYNLQTKQFGPNIHETSFQDNGSGRTQNLGGPYDAIQWFARGFFGVVGPGAVIKDLRIQNVYIQGNNAVGGIVGQVNSPGFPVKIQNCIIDGGVIDAVPLYRGDWRKSDEFFYGRSMARGCYIGGIVGQFCAKDNGDDRAEVINCEVRNITLQGYRRIGGIIGGIADQGTKKMGIDTYQLDIKVEKNAIRNSLMIVNQYRAFNYFWDCLNKDGVWLNGFGWGSGNQYVPMSDNIVGSYYSDNEKDAGGDSFDAFTYGGYAMKYFANRTPYYNYINTNNSVSNLQYCELSVQPDASTSSKNETSEAKERNSNIGNIPLLYIPMFSSLFTDNVNLKSNYYGQTNLHTKVKFEDVVLWYNYSNYKYSIPIQFPNGYDVVYDANSPLTGMYVESVSLNGKDAPGKRSVITPQGVEKEGACVMYVTARDRKQFKDNCPTIDAYITKNGEYSKATNISNVVLRGTPYAWAGILLAPNANMSEVNLVNVTIYDVYKTLALEEVKGGDDLGKQTLQNYTYWDAYNRKDGKSYSYEETDSKPEINLIATNCNFRGYTVPGSGWKNITYTNTTFEQGSETRYSYEDMLDEKKQPSIYRNEYKTCKVEAPTTFDGCYFKAPFYIDLSGESNTNVNFNNCYAASAYGNKEIEAPGNDVVYIEIDKDTEKGKTVIRCYNSENAVIKEY